MKHKVTIDIVILSSNKTNTTLKLLSEVNYL